MPGLHPGLEKPLQILPSSCTPLAKSVTVLREPTTAESDKGGMEAGGREVESTAGSSPQHTLPSSITDAQQPGGAGGVSLKRDRCGQGGEESIHVMERLHC